MHTTRFHPLTAGAVLLLLSALLLVWWNSAREPGNPAQTQAGRQSPVGSGGKFKVDRGGNAPLRLRSNRPQADRSAEIELRKLATTEDLHAVNEALASLTEAGRLGEVENVLRDWCREGSLELAQWSLFFSKQSDSALHLGLCAEALSNPAEAIREHASSELEAASGIRFTDSARASAWLASRPTR